MDLSIQGSNLSMYVDYETNGSRTEPEAENDLFVTKVVVQSVILALAIFGNTCLLCAMRMRKGHYSRMHIFIIHLSFADMLVAFFNILPQLIWGIVGDWLAGDLLCRFVKYMQIFVMYLSTYVLVLTALDRRRAICDPLSSHTWTFRLVHLSVACVYVLSAVLSIPQAIIFKYQETGFGPSEKNCWVHFQPEWTLQVYITTFTFLVYIIPLFILIFAYGSIYYTIFKRQKQSMSENSKSKAVALNSGNDIIQRYLYKGRKNDVISKRMDKSLRQKALAADILTLKDIANGNGDNVSDKRPNNTVNVKRPTPGTLSNLRTNSFAGLTRAKLKTVRLTFVIIVAYIGCWSPFFISQLWWLYDESAPANNRALSIMLLLASLNSCCNPWIYMGFSGFLCRDRSRRGQTHKPELFTDTHSRHRYTLRTASAIGTPITPPPSTSKFLLNNTEC